MKMMFEYNWQVREEWYEWCKNITEEELLKVRTGGVGGILHTLFHIVDVEWSWIREIQGLPDFQESFEEYSSLERIRQLDESFRKEVRPFIESWDGSLENRIHMERLRDGSEFRLTWGEVLRHVIAHEIHHVGQLSVWAREIGGIPVSANLIRRGLSG
ncbi:DinB family protein [Cohnella herbarum]|uniref:Damage-inducible protein DinB n=1 Tax=Cohnella herbarum TaxID=2728023 RepID=A0A7Z2VKQ0_9BACL|nr:DinB family protein [Cohnella herbarum]QJD84857.1 damage-inducible protein DinB [Cohnella herbarum]